MFILVFTTIKIISQKCVIIADAANDPSPPPSVSSKKNGPTIRSQHSTD
jgi:hypothetical protein